METILLKYQKQKKETEKEKIHFKLFLLPFTPYVSINLHLQLKIKTEYKK